MKEISKYIGKKIQEIRSEQKITQEKLGKHLGYSPMGVSHFENGIRDLRFSDLEKIANYFHVKPSYFLPANYTLPQESGVSFFRAEANDDPAIQKSLSDFDSHLDND